MVGSQNVKVLFDIYHQQIMEGNLISRITNNINKIGHFHAAGNPGRHELDTGEIHYENIFEVREETIRVLEILKPGGGYVCGPDQGFPYFPEENIEMVWKTAKEYGVY
jgi:sugar phosphate isomerase/epimerase